MAKPRTSQSRASSSASGRRSAGPRDGAPKGRPGDSPKSRSGDARKSRPGDAESSRPGGRFGDGKPGGGHPPSRSSASKRTPTKAKQQPFAPNEREQREGVRLQKFMASAGVSSRRHAEELITAGVVMVNGKTVKELGTRVFPGRDRVTVRGEPIAAEEKVYFVLNKPDQMVCSAAGSVDERGRATVLSLMHGIPQRLYPVGRLDYHSRGVLILTNDGELAAALTHPRHGVIKTYHVKFQGKLTTEEEDRLRDGIELDDGDVTRPLAELFGFRETDVNTWYQIGLTEGLNRQIRRMGDAIGHPVLKLIRVAIGDITADGLEDGDFRPLSPTEVGQLLSTVKLEALPKRKSANSASAPGKRAGGSRKPSTTSRDDRPAGAKPRSASARTAGASARPGKPSRPQAKPGAQGARSGGKGQGSKPGARGSGKPRK